MGKGDFREGETVEVSLFPTAGYQPAQLHKSQCQGEPGTSSRELPVTTHTKTPPQGHAS